ncbi:MAG TPA: CAP domain-containing protein [Steroidobacteraceae bacterium]|nr:CAP domain-containing protein [Steroidobacteraceae bacterium]
MNRQHQRPIWRLWLLIGALSVACAAQADVLSAVQVLREGGCGGTLPAARPLQHNGLLDRAAEQWAGGRSLAAAAERSGYAAESTASVHISGPSDSAIQLLRQSGCRTLADRRLREIGVYSRGSNTWIVLATPYVLPSKAQAPQLATRALELVNEARARGARCGVRSFGPAPPVRLSGTLADVAFGHAADMAEHNYFEHEDLAGRSPADRVKAVGYQEKLVGENIAYGPKTAEEVVQGWLDSPGHCENIMDPRFAEMGIAYAAGHASRRGLFWVQLLVAPKA